MDKKLSDLLKNDLLLIGLAGLFFFSATYSMNCCGFSFFLLQTLNYLAILLIITYVLIPQLFSKKRYVLFGGSLIILILLGVIVLEGLLEPDATLEEALSWFAIEHEFPSLAISVFWFLVAKFGRDYFLETVLNKESGSPLSALPNPPSNLENTPSVTNNSIQSIFIKSDKAFFKVNVQDILFLKAEDDFVRIHTNDKKYLQAGSLKSWEEQLPSKSFHRIHKSFIIHLDKIDKIAGNRVYINSHEIPIGRSYKNQFLAVIEERMVVKGRK